jgi:hypothetical protein
MEHRECREDRKKQKNVVLSSALDIYTGDESLSAG